MFSVEELAKKEISMKQAAESVLYQKLEFILHIAVRTMKFYELGIHKD